ncbi:hypothetical protein G7046_g6692 [Stylonectria norvegica]|nr:hypothetical protein G7046_g6692 [Stylonectria norvegica]
MADSVPSPKAILRGHKAQIHAAKFIQGNDRLVTGDAEGYLVIWDLTIMRPTAVWQAHEKSILGIQGWGNDKIISHGRDHKLIVWKVGRDDEENLSSTLPVEDVATPRAKPWILHLLEVNTMNFCSFAACASNPGLLDDTPEILIAVPNTLASEAIDIYSLPSQTRIHTIRPGDKNGMAMCLSIFHYKGSLTVVAAFENGFATVHRLNSEGKWLDTYRSQAHNQPVLSLDVHPAYEYFITSSADSIIAKHPIPIIGQEVAFQPESTERVVEIIDVPLSEDSSSAAPRTWRAWKDPLKTINTKHSGQQSLSIRSDGRIFATAGWDSRVRIYSTKTLKELAVLKWHQVGCYAIAFSDITSSSTLVDEPIPQQDASSLNGPTEVSNAKGRETALLSRSLGSVTLSTSVKDRRITQAMTAHWVVAGAKDGKVSLWDIY